jgi:Neurotransmitter-gated ion-channel ligand binding domain
VRRLFAVLAILIAALPADAQVPLPERSPAAAHAPRSPTAEPPVTESFNDTSPAQAPASPTAAVVVAQPPAPAPAAVAKRVPRALTELPLDSGLPLWVRAGLAFVEIDGIDENKRSFTATVDLRLSWLDLRLRYPAEDAPIGYREWRGDAAVARLATIWSPKIGLANLRGDPTRESRSLRLYPNGRVELLRRVLGSFGSSFDVQSFPFDRQKLQVELVSQDEITDKVALDYRQDDLLFSRADPDIAVPGWTMGAVNLTRDPLSGWYGESYARMRVALEVQRQAIETVPALFVPLLASLLIPLLATWLNRSNNGEFEIKAFEMTNIVIGGLFAVIALNFTINSERSVLASGANTVSLLFGLNYLALAASLVINVCLFRFNAVRLIAGRHVQHETFRYITWALPIAIAGTALALILIAAA